MGDLTSLHGQAKRLIVTLQTGLSTLEAIEAGHKAGDAQGFARDLQTKLNDLQRVSLDLDGVWRMALIREPTAKRDTWKRKVEIVAQEMGEIKAVLNRFSGRAMKREVDDAEREELFSRSAAGRREAANMDAESALAASLGRSRQYVEETIETGTAVLVAMAGTKERLKATHRKVLDVLNRVGLGETLLRLIERRQRMDIWTTYGGMVLVLLVTSVLIWWAWF
jgi:Golgi SNAP receptor complex protein 2